MINNGFTPDKEDYEFCTKVDNMVIPSDGFFGISAATGGLAGIILFAVKRLVKNPVVALSSLSKLSHAHRHFISRIFFLLLT